MPTQLRDSSGSIRDDDGRDDLELMLHLRDGDTSALQTLMNRYWDPLIRYAARLVDCLDAAEDVVQETFVKVWNDRARWKPLGRPQAFLYRIVRNGALQQRRRLKLRDRKATELTRRSQPVATPFEFTADEELNHAVQSAIQSLPPRRREAFVLVRYHELSLAEVAETMGVSVQTVANHVSMAVAELRRALQRFPT